MDDPRLHPCGLILDEVEGFAPDWVDEFEDNKHPNQFFMLMSAMHAIQQLTKRINELEKA
jgi:hypothetical protein